VEEVPGGSNIGISPHLVHQELEGHLPCMIVFTFFGLFVFVHSVASSVFVSCETDRSYMQLARLTHCAMLSSNISKTGVYPFALLVCTCMHMLKRCFPRMIFKE